MTSGVYISLFINYLRPIYFILSALLNKFSSSTLSSYTSAIKTVKESPQATSINLLLLKNFTL